MQSVAHVIAMAAPIALFQFPFLSPTDYPGLKWTDIEVTLRLVAMQTVRYVSVHRQHRLLQHFMY